MLSYSVYFEIKRKKMGQRVYLCWVHVCVKFGKKVPLVMEILAKQHRGSFLGHPVHTHNWITQL